MGRAVPKELREDLRSLMEGDTLRLCMYLLASEMAERVAGTSMGPVSSDPGMARLFSLPFWTLEMEDIFRRELGLVGTWRSDSSKADGDMLCRGRKAKNAKDRSGYQE
jgi:hypothetical protein